MTELDLSKQKVLVCEDCPIQRAKMKIILQSTGIELKMAENGIEGIKYFLESSQWTPDVVLTDIHMPGMDGLELCKKIKSIRPEVRIVVMTGTADDRALVQAFKYGAIDFIRKPVNKMELMARLKSVFQIIINEQKLKNALCKLEESNLVLKKLSSEDSLTKLLNRRAFYNLLSTEVCNSESCRVPISVFMFDVDDFKSVNDKYGHQAGDEVLICIANILKNNLRNTDYACRFGGDEFIIVMSYTNIEEAMELIEDIKMKINSSVIASAPGLNVKISGGICQKCGESNQEELIEIVDKGLYLAKEKGKNRIEVIRNN